MRGFVLIWALLIPIAAHAQAPGLPADDEEEEVPEVSPSPQPVPTLEPDEPEEASVEDRLARVEAELAQAEATRPQPFPVTFRGYFDLGFYAPQGDGAGIIQDFGDTILRRVRPNDAGKFAWVFIGDILATGINSRGEAADLGPDPGVTRFDSVNSRGAIGAIMNEANFTLDVGFSDWGKGTVSVNVVPRSGVEFSIGDFIDLDIAQLEVIVSDAIPTSVFVGKVEPVIGVEYKRRRADSRFGITPSLIARYTTGSQLGIKARTKLLGGWVIIAAALTNQSATTEQFHFSEEIDSNDGKTGSGRVALSIPLLELFPETFTSSLEIGGNILVGAQDRALDTDGLLHFEGVDFEYHGVDLMMSGQIISGGSPGRASDLAYGLDLVAAGYLEIAYMFTGMFGASVRGDFRNAWVTLGFERAYLTKSWRVTGGLRAVFSRHLTLKAEYLHNGEYTDLPSIENDVFTSSLVVSY